MQSANLRNRHKVPGNSGSNGRLATGFSRMVLRRISGVFSSSIALGGYRAWGCQVAEKCQPIEAEPGTKIEENRPL